MQSKLLILCLFFMLGFQVQSQTTYDYLSRPGLTFVAEYHEWIGGSVNNTYKYVGDTLLCGENLLVYQSASTFKNFLRVEGGKVWRRPSHDPCESEQLIYEFDLEIGDITQAFFFNTRYVVDTETITLLNGEERQQIYLAANHHDYHVAVIDGIGHENTGLFPLPMGIERWNTFICVKENDEIIWLHPDYSPEMCDSIACFNPIPDFEYEIDEFQVHFENHSLNHSSVHWDFGDRHTSTELHASHHYDHPGCYEVTLSLGSDCLNRTFEKQLLVPVCFGQEWQVKTPDFATSHFFLKVDFVNESVGWAIDRDHIWKTEDGGVSWTEQLYPLPPEPINRNLATIDMVDEMNGVIGVYNFSAPSSIEGFLVTNDGGTTWEEKMPGSYIITSAIMTDDGQVFGTGQFDGVFYSNDWGNSFVHRSSQGVDFSEFQYLGNNELVAIGLQGLPPTNATSAISFSDDSGQSWTHHLMPSVYYGSRGLHFFNANEGFVSGYEGFLLKTVDGGQSWQEIPYDDERQATNIYFVDEQVGWAIGNGGLLLSTTDGGRNWEVGNCGYRNNLISISALDAENCWVGSNNGEYLELDAEAEADCAPVNIHELDPEDNRLLIFPNPTSDEVTIHLPNSDASSANNRIVVYNNLGQNIFEDSIPDETLVINTAAWSSGVYYIIWLQNERVIGSEKLIVLD